MRLIIANIFAEYEFAARPVPTLSAVAQAQLAKLIATLAIFAEPGDVLWSPLAIDASLVAPWLQVEKGKLSEDRLKNIADGREILAWAETQAVARLREANADSVQQTVVLPGVSPWEVARRCNHREFAFGLAQRQGAALPGASRVTSFEQCASAIAEASSYGFSGQWIAKAVFSAAGRERIRGQHSQVEKDEATRLRRLLQDFGGLLIEPWLDRTADFGTCGVVNSEDVVIFESHRQEVSARGQFAGIVVNASIEPDLSAQLQHAAQIAGAALQCAGYRGAFTLDSFMYRDPNGADKLHSYCEINARMSFGLVAKAYADRCKSLYPFRFPEDIAKL